MAQTVKSRNSETLGQVGKLWVWLRGPLLSIRRRIRKLPMSASGLYKQGHIYVHVLPPHTHTNTHVNINTHIHTYTKKILFFLPNLTAKIYFKKMCRKNKFLYTTYTHSDTNAQIQVQSMRFEFLLLKLSEICCSVSAYLAANEGHWRNELCQVS